MVVKYKPATSRISAMSGMAGQPPQPGAPPPIEYNQSRQEVPPPPQMPAPSSRDTEITQPQPPQQQQQAQTGSSELEEYEIPATGGQVTFQDQSSPASPPPPSAPRGAQSLAVLDGAGKKWGLPIWAWILIGILAAGGVCMVIGIVIGKRRRSTAVSTQ